MVETTIENEERLAYLALAHTPGIGPRKLAVLLSKFGSPLAIIQAPTAFLGPDERALRPLTTSPSKAIAEAAAHEAQVAADGISILTPADTIYPAQLRQIPDPPLILYALGNLELLERPAVAIVGSRDHTQYGKDAARMIATAAARAGIVVVSGMARGLDAVAHQGALDARGTTIGVLGNGIRFIYPKTNQKLYQQVEQEGLLLSEHAPTLPPHSGAFPRRNRLISGLAKVLVVVEAAQGSGTMLTVASALEQGREVMAVPGPINSRTSAGTNHLLRDGAEPLLSPEDLLARYSITAQKSPTLQTEQLLPPPSHLSPEEARVFDVLTHDGRHIDDLTLAVGLPVGTMLAVLCGLELGGLAEQLPGSQFRRASRSWAARTD